MKVFIVMPVFNAEQTLEKTYRDLPAVLRTHVVVGDNCSTDGTYAVAKRLGVNILRHEKNHGYGGNLKRLYRYALDQGADIVVELHGDYQYDPRLIDVLVTYLQRGYFDVMYGNRMRSWDEAKAGGMHWYRYLGNRLLTTVENCWFGVNLCEWHSGMKAFRVDALRQLPFETYPDTHAFANDILMDCIMKGFRVAEIPIPVRYQDDSSSISVPDLFAYTWKAMWAALKRPRWKKRPFGAAQLPPLSPDQENGTDPLKRTGTLPEVTTATAASETTP